ncbi:MAG: S9 family peptidase [Arsenophonus sp. ER-EMS1-MAG3]
MIIPVAEKQPHKMVLHGDTRIDNYYWLRDDTRKNKKIIKYLIQENQYTNTVLKSGISLKKQLFAEMSARIEQQDKSVPYLYNGYIYQIFYQNGKEYPIYRRKQINKNAIWQILVNGNERSNGHQFYTLDSISISDDNQHLAISEDFQGRRQFQISFRQLNNKKWQNSIIKNTSGNIVWANDSHIIYYVRNHPKTLLAYQIYCHYYGKKDIKDKKIYQENDDRFYLSIKKSSSKDYVLICISNTETSEYRLINANNLTETPKIFLARQAGHEYELDHFHDHFYIRSNYQSKQFGLYVTQSIEKPWKTIILPNKDIDLEHFYTFNKYLVIEERHNGLVNIRQINWKTKQQNNIQFDESIYSAWIGYNPEPNSDILRYGYSSLITPISIMQINMLTQKCELLKKQRVYGFDKSLYFSERIWIEVRDGTKVPVSLVYRKDLWKKFENPILIYGYGAYGINLDPIFSSTRLSLLDRGFIYALIHVRGGGDLGKDWYQHGKLKNKVNSFNDFIDVTKILIKNGYCSKKRVYAMGASAGGLLVTGVINQEPELYRGIIAQVPFVDVITTMLDSSIPLTTREYDEWGNPAEKEVYFRLKSYSPYDNIKRQHYPNLLVTTSLYDSQVQYWEPVKFVAKLREYKINNTILLLKINMKAGHDGRVGRFNQLKDIALQYSFILMLDDNKKYFADFDFE